MKLSDICNNNIKAHMTKALCDSHSQYFLNLLNEYDANLSSMLFYGAISYSSLTLTAGTEYEYDKIADPQGYGPQKAFDLLLRPKNERYVELPSLYTYSNIDSEKFIYIPVYVDGKKLCYVCSPNKDELLDYLGIDSGKDIYEKYPILIALLKWGITYIVSDDTDDRLSDLYITTVRISEDYTNLKTSIVDAALKEMWLPYSSTIHAISGWEYEKQANYGYIDFRRPMGHFNKKETITFANPFLLSVRDARTIRKYVELSDERNRLIAQSSKGFIIGECMPEDLYWSFLGLGEHDDNDVVATVRFEGKSSWRMFFEKETIFYNGTTFSFKHERPEEPDYIARIDEFCYGLSLVSSESMENKKTILKRLMKVATKQKHGTMIVIMPDAKEEAERLCGCGRGIKINPIDFGKMINEDEKMGQDILYNLTKIDGAVFFDDNGICYSIGTIVDGFACANSNPGRGARFNSGLTYTNYCNERNMICFCAVISEDETVDIFGCCGNKRYKEMEEALLKEKN